MSQTAMPSVKWSEVLTLLSPDGQQQLVDFVHRAQAERGANWLPEIEAEFPMFSWIVDLVCNKTEDEAFAELQREFPVLPLAMLRGKIGQLHTTLKTEIERKR